MRYLEKHAFYPPLIEERPSDDLSMLVVIPVFDEPALLNSLQCLAACDPLVDGSLEVIVVINHGERAEEQAKLQNEQTFREAKDWATQNSRAACRFHILYCPDLPHKQAGVGLARKIGMDEAVRRLQRANQPKGIILCFDADTLCPLDYLQSVGAYFKKHPKCPGVSIAYKHPIEGNDFPSEVYSAIIDYELHLRYFLAAKQWAGFPYAFETIGSAMAVRADVYQQQGGMNKRKAGEDFYFLNKFTVLDHFGEITNTAVFPSPRRSHRVPFGTGRAVAEMLDRQGPYKTYAPSSFIELKQTFEALPFIYVEDKLDWEARLPLQMKAYLAQLGFEEKLQELRQHTRSFDGFRKRFFRWFNAFLIMKFVHFARDRAYPDVAVGEAANWLLKHLKQPIANEKDAKQLLLQYRQLAYRD
ncbi:MAG: glycosyltransferase family A protein [Bacteroidota bacterium]